MKVGSSLTVSNISRSTANRSGSDTRYSDVPEVSNAGNSTSNPDNNGSFSTQAARWSTAAGHNLYKQVQGLKAGEGSLERAPQDVEDAARESIGNSVDTFA